MSQFENGSVASGLVGGSGDYEGKVCVRTWGYVCDTG